MTVYNLSPEQQRELIDAIFRYRVSTYLCYGLGANAEMVRSAYRGAYDGSAESYRALCAVAVDAAKRGQLIQNPQHIEAYQQAFSGDAQQKAGLGCNDDMILQGLVDRRLDCTVENVRAMISACWDDLADNPEYTEREHISKVRAHRIAEMTKNGTAGFSVQVGTQVFPFDKFGRPYDYQNGMGGQGTLALKGPWSAGQGRGFEGMTDDEVENLYTLFKTSQDYKSMSREELRKVVKANGATDAFGKNVRPPTSVPDPQDRLYHPQTGEAFTQKSLIRYINNPNDPYCGRRLITHPSSGKTVPRLRVLFEKTIRGDFEERT